MGASSFASSRRPQTFILHALASLFGVMDTAAMESHPVGKATRGPSSGHSGKPAGLIRRQIQARRRRDEGR